MPFPDAPDDDDTASHARPPGLRGDDARYWLASVNARAIERFLRRAAQRNDPPGFCLIVVANVDDEFGGPLAQHLMPGHDWQRYRDRGLMPIARGLAGRQGLTGLLLETCPAVGQAMVDLGPGHVPLLVFDDGGVSLFCAEGFLLGLQSRTS